MAVAACTLKHVGASASKCTENYSGVGTSVYVFFPDDLTAEPAYSEEFAGFDKSSFAFKEGTGAWEIKIKKKSGKVTFESNPQGGGFNNTLTFVVNNDMETMSFINRVINNRDTGWMVQDGSGKFYVLYDPVFAPEVSSSGDTGDTPDSDHGITITVTASPMRYGFAKWDGPITLAPANSAAPTPPVE